MCNKGPKVDLILGSFEGWMAKRKNQRLFTNLQEAYRLWLEDTGFDYGVNSYTVAVHVILVFLSRCVANPTYGRLDIFSHKDLEEPDGEFIIQVAAMLPQGGEEERTYWEFLTEEHFNEMYQAYLRVQERRERYARNK